MVTTFLARFTQNGPAVLLAGLGAVLVTCVLMRAWRGHADYRLRLTQLFLADALLLIGLFTLLRASGGGKAVNLIPGSGVGVIEFAANAALFVPAGLLARLVFRRWLLPLAVIGLGLPTLIEVLQYYLSLNRISDVNDVLANALGTSLGFVIPAAGCFLGTSDSSTKAVADSSEAQDGDVSIVHQSR